MQPDSNAQRRLRVVPDDDDCDPAAMWLDVINAAPDVIAVFDADDVVRHVNPAFERLLGRPRSEVVDRPAPTALVGVDRGFIERFLERGDRDGRSRTTRVQLPDGGRRFFEVAVQRSSTNDPEAAWTAVFAHDVTERVESAAGLTHRALHDALTGLPNRALLLDRLEHALARSRRRLGTCAVLFMDLDRFKAVNDTWGHPVGDELLVAVADRLRSVVRAEDTVARLGGDEYVILLEQVNDEAEAHLLAERVKAALAEPLALSVGEVTISGSIGVAFGVDRTGPELLAEADRSMYEAKRRC